MNFNFDDLSKKATEIFHTAVKKTTGAVETAKLSYNISAIEHDLNNAYTALGKKVYFSNDDIANINIENEIEAIDLLNQKINSAKENLSFARSTCSCPYCGAKVNKNDDFCKKCGAKLN